MFRSMSVTITSIVAMGLYLQAGQTVAQESEQQQARGTMEEVIVEAPVVRRKVGSTGPTGYTTEIIELKREVTISDLDLTKSSDVMELEKRVEMAAQAACESIEEMLPADQRSDAHEVRRCVEKAVANTEAEIKAAVAAAN